MIFNKTTEKRKLRDVLELPRHLIRTLDKEQVKRIRKKWKTTGYIAPVLVGILPSKQEYVIGSNHLLSSLEDEKPDFMVSVEIVEVPDKTSLDLVAEAHNFTVPLTQYDRAKIIRRSAEKHGIKETAERWGISEGNVKKQISFANMPEEFAPYIPAAKSMATVEKPFTYSHWYYITKTEDETRAQKKMGWRLIKEVQETQQVISRDLFRSVVGQLKEDSNLLIWDAIKEKKKSNKMIDGGIGLDTIEKFDVMEKLLRSFNAKPEIVYNAGAQEVYREKEDGTKINTEIPRLNDMEFIERVVLIGKDLKNSATNTISYANKNDKFRVARVGMFHDWLIKARSSKKPCAFIIDFCGLGVTPATLKVMFTKFPNAHVIMTVVNLFDSRHNKYPVAAFLCNMGVGVRPKTLKEYVSSVFLPEYGKVGNCQVFMMKNNKLALASIEKLRCPELLDAQ